MSSAGDRPDATILVVDDFEDARSQVRVILQQAGFTVAEAATGTQALAMAGSQTDLIILDVYLPDVDGFEVCRRLKGNAATASIPVLHLSAAYRDVEHRVRALEGGADGYLTRPFEPAELLATVKALLRIRRAEAELREIQDRYRRVIDTALEGVWTVDTDIRTTYVNRQMAAMLGYTVTEMLGRPLYDFVDESARGEAERHFERRRWGMRAPADLRFRRKDETYLWAIVSTTPIVGDDGRFLGALGLVTDITERKRAEQGLARLASIVECSDDAIIGKTLDGVITSWNASAERISGYSRVEVLGRAITTLLPPDRSEEVPPILERLVRGERIESSETVWLRKDGTPIDVSVTISPIRDADGRVTGASVIARDITERKRAEAAMRNAQALRSVATLATAAAHEINNPLSVVIANLELMERRDPGPDWPRYAELALGAAERIRQIVRFLNRITRLELAESSPNLPNMLDLRKSSSGDE